MFQARWVIVKIATKRSASRYQNEVVYRSAERLMASRPAKKNRVPMRGVLLLVSLVMFAAGFVFRGFLGVRDNAENQSGGQIQTTAAVVETEFTLAGKVRPVASQTKSVANTGMQPAGTQGARSARPAGEGSEKEVEQAAVLPAPEGPGMGERAAARPVASVPVARETVIQTTTVVELSLWGSMEGESMFYATFEFVLRRNGKAISGVVRYFNTAGDRVAAYTMAGEMDGRTITLRETGLAWTKRGFVNEYDPVRAGVARAFVFDLPEKVGDDSIPGTWTFGRRGGAMTLMPSPGW